LNELRKLSEGSGSRSNIWYVSKRSYDTAIGLKAIAYNLMIVSNFESGEKPREIMKIVGC
jgi:hypothetical protein